MKMMFGFGGQGVVDRALASHPTRKFLQLELFSLATASDQQSIKSINTQRT